MYTCTSEGQPLVEVFGVRFLHGGGQAPAGTVSVFDGKRGQIIYNGDDKSSSRKTQGSGGWLPLTGPYRAISADGCVAIVLDLHHDDDASPVPPTEIILDVYDEATRYDELTTRSDGRGAEVTYALLSDAAEAIVEVRLLGPGASGTVTVTGRVVAQTDLGKVVLFDDNDDAGTGAEEGIVPLARSVVAVPLASSLTVEVDLVIGGGDAVKESVVCAPKIRGDDVHPCSTMEVKITWLD